MNIRRIAVGRRLLDDVSLAVAPGERLAIVGPTGSGKTLLLRTLARLDPVDAGEIRWNGEPVLGNAVPRFRARVMYLHQRPALVEGTVEHNLRLPFTLRSRQHAAFSRDTVLKLLDDVGRDESFLRRSGRDLSGGEAQIVAVLRAVQLDPDVLLLDEPTAALDEASAASIEQLVHRWHEQSADRALIWVSHNPQQVQRIANRVVRMAGGQLTEQPASDQESPA